MRMVVTTLMILIWTTSYGQFDKYKGTWISNFQDVMIIKDTINESFNISKRVRQLSHFIFTLYPNP